MQALIFPPNEAALSKRWIFQPRKRDRTDCLGLGASLEQESLGPGSKRQSGKLFGGGASRCYNRSGHAAPYRASTRPGYPRPRCLDRRHS